MSNTTRSTRRPNALRIRSLRQRLAIQKDEAAECTTEAMYRCVMESVADTERQLAEALQG
jgi:hypothetical protein